MREAVQRVRGGSGEDSGFGKRGLKGGLRGVCFGFFGGSGALDVSRDRKKKLPDPFVILAADRMKFVAHGLKFRAELVFSRLDPWLVALAQDDDLLFL